jgi:hypothetical protein
MNTNKRKRSGRWVLALAVASVSLTAVGSAQAYDRRYDHRDHRDHWHHDRGVYVTPPPAVYYGPPAPPPGITLTFR